MKLSFTHISDIMCRTRDIRLDVHDFHLEKVGKVIFQIMQYFSFTDKKILNSISLVIFSVIRMLNIEL